MPAMRMVLATLALLLMATPLTDPEKELSPQEIQSTLDFLGRPAPLFSSGQPALPVGIAAPAPSTAPAGPSGAGATPAESASAQVAGVEPPAGADSAGTILKLVGQGIGGAKSATQAAKSALGTDAPAPASDRLGPGVASSTGDIDPALVGELTRSGFLESTTAPAGVFSGVAPSGPVSTEGVGISPGALDLAGAGLSSASLAALIAQLAQSGKISPRQATGLLQSGGGTASSLSSVLGPAPAGQTGGALSGTLSPELAGALGLGGEILGGAGAVGSVGLALKNEFDALRAGRDDPRQYASAAGSELGLAAGGILGSVIAPGYGTLIGLGAGGAAGTAIGQAIAKNLPQTHYAAQREHWGEVATDAVNAYGFGIQKAASNGGLPEIQQALSQGYADGHVRAYLTLPDTIAAKIGVPAYGPFDAMSQEQFVMLLKAFSERDPSISDRWVAASGDVQFLDQGRAQGVADATRQTATATLAALAQEFKPILDQMPTFDPEGLASDEARKIEASELAALEAQRLSLPLLADAGQSQE